MADFMLGKISYPGGPWKMCDGQDLGDFLGDGQICHGWGPNQEIFATFNPKTKKLQSMWMQPGYTGAMTCYSRAGSVFEAGTPHTYTLTLGSRVLKDGMPIDFSADWGPNKTNPKAFLNELYDACLATFTPMAAPEPGVLPDAGGQFPPLVSCAAKGDCVIGAFSDGSQYWFVKSIGFGWLVTNVTSGPEVATTPTNFQLYVK